MGINKHFSVSAKVFNWQVCTNLSSLTQNLLLSDQLLGGVPEALVFSLSDTLLLRAATWWQGCRWFPHPGWLNFWLMSINLLPNEP